MPSGKTHLRIELAALVAVVGGGLALNRAYGWMKWEEAQTLLPAFVAAYLFSSLLLSPDLDLARSGPQSRWGLFRALWLPYAGLFRHRGLSHNPLFGPLSRAAYLGILLAGALAGLHYGFGVELKFLKHWWQDLQGRPLWAIGIGMLLPNELHILADKLFKG